DSDSAFLIG
uniref:[Phe6]-mosact n=1 Tax=Clypeaster japonicus TaxID=7644 RepID=MOSF_CLYJA|nr:RecName: Full=[Phe6]-mosact [Clypeaster japonicus]